MNQPLLPVTLESPRRPPPATGGLRMVTGGALSGSVFSAVFGRSNHDSPTLKPGTRVGKFEVFEEIGRGGASVVYRAERCDGSFTQMVALKIAHANAELRERARLERDLLGRLRHPRIAQIFDGGETADGDIWFAMELVMGQHIDRYCDSRQLDWRARLRLLLDVCDAVQHAHQCLIVHRDIKPNNIVVDPHGNLKLLDFGVSGHPEGDEERGSEPVALTPEFASPEQFTSKSVTTASDVFQIGRVMEHLLEATPNLSRRIARNLAAIVARATMPDPPRRYATVAALREDISRALGLHLCRARQWSWPHRLEFLVQRNGQATTLLLLLIALTALLNAHFARQTAEATSRIRSETLRTVRAKEFLLELIARDDSYSFQSDPALSAVALLEDAATQTQRSLHDVPEAEAELNGNLAVGMLRLGSRAQARELVDRAVVQARGLADFPPEKLARLLVSQATVHAETGDGDGARLQYEEALQTLAGNGRTEALIRIEVQSGMARLHERRGDYQSALALRRETLRQRKDLLGPEHPDYALNLRDIAAAQAWLGDYAGAEKNYREALSLLTRSLGAEHPQVGHLWSGLGTVLQNRGEYADALDAQQRALALFEKSGKPQARFAAVARAALADLQRITGRIEQALPELDLAHAVLRDAGWAEDADVQTLRAKALYDAGRFADALSAVEDAHRQLVAQHGQSHPATLHAAALANLVRYRLGQTENALARMQAVRVEIQAQPATPAPMLADVLFWSARISEWAGDVGQACGLYAEAAALAKRLSAADPNVREAHKARSELACALMPGLQD